MEPSRPVRPMRYGILSFALVICMLVGFEYKAIAERNSHELSANYVLGFPQPPKGWKEIPHGPQTLFLYRQADTRVLINGGINQMVAEANPTPELGTEQLADRLIEMTRRNMPGWAAEKMGEVTADGAKFRLVRRSQKLLTVITAFAVRGNTTILISLSGRDTHVSDVEKDMDQFRQFLSSVKLTRTDLSNL